MNIIIKAIAYGIVCIPFSGFSEDKTEIKVKTDTYFHENGEVAEVVSFYIDSKQRKIKHGRSQIFRRDSTLSYDYSHGALVSVGHHAQVAHPKNVRPGQPK